MNNNRSMKNNNGMTNGDNGVGQILDEVKEPTEAPRHQWWTEPGETTTPPPVQEDFN